MPVIKKPSTKKIDQVVWQFEALQDQGQGLTLDIAAAIGEEIVNEMTSMIDHNLVTPKSKYMAIRFRTKDNVDEKNWPRKTGKTLYQTGQFRNSLGWAAARFRRGEKYSGKTRLRSAYVVVGAAPEIYKASKTHGLIDPNNLSKEGYAVGGTDRRIKGEESEKKSNRTIFVVQELGAIANPKYKGTNSRAANLFVTPKHHPKRELLKNALRRVGIKRVVSEVFAEDFKEIRSSGRIPLRDTHRRNPNKNIMVYTDEYSIKKIKGLDINPRKSGKKTSQPNIPPGMRDFLNRFSRTGYKYDAAKFQRTLQQKTGVTPEIEVSWKQFTGKRTNYVSDFAFGRKIKEEPEQWIVSGGELTSFYPGLMISSSIWEPSAGSKQWNEAQRLGQNILNRPVLDLISAAKAGIPSNPKKADKFFRDHYIYHGLETRAVRDKQGKIIGYDKTRSQNYFENIVQSTKPEYKLEDLRGKLVPRKDLDELIKIGEKIEKTKNPVTKIHSDMVKLTSLTQDKKDLSIVMGFGGNLPAGTAFEKDGKTLTVVNFADRIIVQKVKVERRGKLVEEEKIFKAYPDPKTGEFPKESIRVTKFLEDKLSIEGRTVMIEQYDPDNFRPFIENLETRGLEFDMNRLFAEGKISKSIQGAPKIRKIETQRKRKKIPREEISIGKQPFPKGVKPIPLYQARIETDLPYDYFVKLDKTKPKSELIKKFGISPETKFNTFEELESKLNSRLPLGDQKQGEGWLVTQLKFDAKQRKHAIQIKVKGKWEKATHVTFKYVTNKEKFEQEKYRVTPFQFDFGQLRRIEGMTTTSGKRQGEKPRNQIQQQRTFNFQTHIDKGRIKREPTAENKAELAKHLTKLVESKEEILWFDRFELLEIYEDSKWTQNQLRSYLRHFFGDQIEIDIQKQFEYNYMSTRRGGILVISPKEKVEGKILQPAPFRIKAIRVKRKDVTRRVQTKPITERKGTPTKENPQWTAWYKKNKDYFNEQVQTTVRNVDKFVWFQMRADILQAFSSGDPDLLQAVIQNFKNLFGIDLSKMNSNFIQFYINKVNQLM